MNVMPAIKIEKEAITSKDTRGGCMRKNKTRSKINQCKKGFANNQNLQRHMKICREVSSAV